MPPTNVRKLAGDPTQPVVARLVKKLQAHVDEGGELGDAASRPTTDALAIQLAKRAHASPMSGLAFLLAR